MPVGEATGVAFALVAVANGVMLGCALGVADGTAFVVATGVAVELTDGEAIGVVLGWGTFVGARVADAGLVDGLGVAETLGGTLVVVGVGPSANAEGATTNVASKITASMKLARTQDNAFRTP